MKRKPARRKEKYGRKEIWKMTEDHYPSRKTEREEGWIKSGINCGQVEEMTW